MNVLMSRPNYLLALLGLLPLLYYWVNTPNSLTPGRKRGALWLRVLSIVCLVLALAGAQVVSRSHHLTVLFLLDRSLSTGGDSQAWQHNYINQALKQKKEGDQFGVLLFGGDTGIEIPAGAWTTAELGPITTVVDRQSTQLTSALRFAATSFPDHTVSRLIVITDGQSTEGSAQAEVRTLSDAGIEVWLVPLPEQTSKEVLISRFETPSQIAKNEPFLIRTVIESRGIESCDLVITENGKPKQNLHLTLREGPNLFLLPQQRPESGPVRYQARIVSPEDERPENNKAEALSIVGNEQTVLVLRHALEEGSLVPLLRQAGLNARAVTPAELPKDVGSWRDVTCLIIEDVDSLQWSKKLQTVVSLLVRDGGMGLVMCGSNATFGMGAYQNTPIEDLLPVNLAVRRAKDEPLSALVQCIDKSGSMSGDPIRMAREAAIAAGETLAENDLLGVVGFDSAARWIVALAPKGDGQALRRGVSTLRAGGGTDLYPAFKEALDKLEVIEAPLKHMVVLSDGAVGSADYDSLIQRANRLKVTISAVAFGEGADIRFLEDLARKGKGRLYRSEQTSQGSTLAQIFVRDTVLATGAGIQDEPVKILTTKAGEVSPILTGLEFQSSPQLLAHNMASEKGGTARTLLESPGKDPILAVGRAGLGYSAAWLSDLGGDWARPWDSVPGASATLSLLETILIRTIRSTVASDVQAVSARGNRLSLRSSLSTEMAKLELELFTQKALSGPVRMVTIAQNGTSQEALIQPRGPFSAEGTITVTQPGSGLIIAQDLEGHILARTNFTVPLAPEFSHLGTDRSRLKSWSQVPRGRFEPSPESVFEKPSRPIPLSSPLERDLAKGALLLLLLEIAVRRLPAPKSRTVKTTSITPAKSEHATRLARLQAAKEAASTKRHPKGPQQAKPLKFERLASERSAAGKSAYVLKSDTDKQADLPETTQTKLKKAREKKRE